MHDASLCTILVHLMGIRRFEEFFLRFLRNVAEWWKTIGTTLDAANQNVLTLRRSNRSLVGLLNSAKQLIEFTVADQMEAGWSIDWNKAQRFVNRTPFSMIGDEFSLEKLECILRPV